MNRLITTITFIFFISLTCAITLRAADCPTNAPTVIEVCNDSGGNSTIRAYFYNGNEAQSYFLYSLTTGEYVGPAPLGPVIVDASIPFPPGAVDGVEFRGVPDGDYVIRVNCSPSGSVNIGGLGINVNSANALTATSLIDPDCNPLSGGANADGAIELFVSGGDEPYDITWPLAVTPIADKNNAAAGNHNFTNLDGGLYTVQITDASNCTFTADINIPITTTPQAGADQNVCGPSANLNANAAGAGETGAWTGPAGVTFSPDANTPNAVANNLSPGSNTLTWTITDINGFCPGLTDDVIITTSDPATVDAGVPQIICTGNNVVLAGGFGGSATGITWTTSGDGTFDNASLPAATYTPGTADMAGGTVTLTITTNDPAGPCLAVSANVVITIDAAASVEAGAAQAICSNGTATMAGSFGGVASSVTWTTSGDGSFDNTSLPNAVYTPGPTDITNGTATLTLTTDDPAGPCLPASDNVIITIDMAATADAGTPQIVCAGSTVSLAGALGGTASSSTWTTNGDGTFDNANILNAVYTPGTADVASGTVTLTLTTNDPSGPCAPANDNVVITINAVATADAGATQTICSDGTATLAGAFAGAATSAVWTTSGDGTFDDPSLVNAIYTPGTNDITAQTVTLTLTTNDPAGPCLPANDNVVIAIDEAPQVFAGAAQTICAGSTVALSGFVGGTATSATWTTTGDGTFDNPASVTAIYTPGATDLAAGTVTLTITSNDPAGPCGPKNDNVVITINSGATVDAGLPQTICSGNIVTLAGSFGGAASAGSWTTLGDGTFNDPALANAVYTPGTNDLVTGNVTLTFTTDDPAGPCLPVNDNVVVTIENATAEAGPSQTICTGSTVALAGAIGGTATSATWSTAGDGTFNNASSLNAIYTPGTADIAAGAVTLTLTTDDPTGPCVSVSDNVLITIDAGALVDAGSVQTVCAGSTIALSASIGGTATSATWTTSGDGSFNNVTSPTAIYTPGNNDISSGTVTLTFTTDDPVGPCLPANDNVVITIDAVPQADAGPVQTICSGATATMAGFIGGSATSAVWTTSGDGTFDDATSVTAIYTPGTADIAAGTVTLTITSDDPPGPCLAVTDNVVITLDPLPAADAGNIQTICPAGTASLSGSSVGGSATTGAWSVVNQPTGGDGLLSDVSQTASPATVTFTATVAGDYTLRLTTNDPAGVCNAVTDDVIITVTAPATAAAGSDQNICIGATVTLAGSFTGSTGIAWSTSGDGAFNDPSLPNAVYTPGATDISNTTVTLTITTGGPCAPASDAMLVTIDPAATIDAGLPQAICAGSSVVLNASFGGSATGLLWTSSGDGAFTDTTDPNSGYTPGATDILNGTVTLTATTTGNCAGVADNVTLTLDPAATVDAGSPQAICVGSTVALAATLGGAATTLTWTTSGDGSFNSATDPSAVYTPGANDLSNGTVTLTATTDNPAGPCPAANDNVVITFMAIPGDQTTPGNETWIGYLYDDAADPTPIPGKIDFNSSKYRGFIDETDIDNMSTASAYDAGTDVFDLNPGLATPLQGPNLCGSHLNSFSVRYKMNKTFAAGIYRFTVGADDGVRLLIDGVNVLPATAFDFQSYTTYTSQPVCLTAGSHTFEIHYFDNTAESRLTFDYEQVPGLTATSPLAACVNSPAPTLTASSVDTDVVDFNWYKNGALFFTGANYTPAASELDMSTVAATTFQVTAVYACGETQPADVVVDVVNSATLVISPQTICESTGVVDLRTLVDESPAGGTFVFAGHANISGNNFGPTGLAGTTVSITVDYSIGSCNAPQGTLALSITNTATINVPSSPVSVCEGAADVDLAALVSAVPAGGTFAFSGTQVIAGMFDPSGLSGIQTITVDYSVGCTAPSTTFEIDVSSTTSMTANNANACENGSPVNLLTLVSATPAGGIYNFSGTGVSGNTFNPSGQSGTIDIAVDYDFNGCTDNGIIQVTVLSSSNAACVGGNCATVVIVPKTQPATCTNSDGRLIMSIKPFTPAVNNTGVKITIAGISSTNLPISRTIYNDSVFNALPVGSYDYTIEYGDPSCIKNGQFSIDQSGTVGTPVASNVISPLCVGSATGSLTLDVPGETGNLLEWSLDAGLTDPFKPFTAGGQITGIPAGPSPSFQQVISVRRNIGDVCYASVTVVMAETVQQISATFNITPSTCNGNDGSITNIVPGGGSGGPYTYSIDGGQTFQTGTAFSALAGGSYTLRVRDVSGCENDFTANVTFPGFISFAISKSNANCTNDGKSGSITVTVNEAGSFAVALTQDQFNQPADAEYQSYNQPFINFNSLSRGEYYVFVKSNGGGCPTRSAPINIFGVYPLDFDIERICNGNEVSLALTNVTGEPGTSMEIQVTKKLSPDPPVIITQPFPTNGEIYLDYDQHAFLKTPGEYGLRIVQFQNEVTCNVSSGPVDIILSQPLQVQIGPVSESYPDIPTGAFQVRAFSGGIYPYQVRIELDSASSFALPDFSTNFEEAGINQNQEIERSYDQVPPGRYQVQVMDSIGCVLNLIARVPMDKELFIPNVFTPNGDESNDVFFIRNLPQEPTVNQLIISNRWGKEVFAAKNYQNNWDGGGAADGIYFYRLQVGDNDALTGWVEIIRGPKP